MPAGHLDAAGGPDITRVREQQLRRQHPAGNRMAWPVQIGQHGVEQPGALHQTGFQGVPVRRGEHQRQRVEVPRSRLRGAVAVGDRFAVPVDLDVGDAVVVDQAADDRPQPVQATAAALAHAFGQLPPCGADIARGVDELVVTGARTGTNVEQRLLSPGGAIPGQQVVDVVRADTGDCRRAACGKCHYCKTVRTRRRSKMPGAPTSVD